MSVTSLFRALCCFSVIVVSSTTSSCTWGAFEISSAAQEGNGKVVMAVKLDNPEAETLCKELCCDSVDCSIMAYLPFADTGENNCQLWKCTTSEDNCINGIGANATVLIKKLDDPGISQTKSSTTQTAATPPTRELKITDDPTPKPPNQTTIHPPTRTPSPSSSSLQTSSITSQAALFPKSLLTSTSASSVSSQHVTWPISETTSSTRQKQSSTQDQQVYEPQTTMEPPVTQTETTGGNQTDFPTPPAPRNTPLTYPTPVPQETVKQSTSSVLQTTVITSSTSSAINQTSISPGQTIITKARDPATNSGQLHSSSNDTSRDPDTEQSTWSLKTTVTALKTTVTASLADINTAQYTTKLQINETSNIGQVNSSEATPRPTTFSHFTSSSISLTKQLVHNRTNTTESPTQAVATFYIHHENSTDDIRENITARPEQGDIANTTTAKQMNSSTVNSTITSSSEDADSIESDQDASGISRVKPIMPVSLIAVLAFGIIFLAAALVLVGRRVYNSWQRRHYNRVDFLVNGMYN